MFDGQFRATSDRTLKPVGQQLTRTGITANQLTVVGITVACAAAIAIGNGALRLGLLLLVLAALPDVLDGAVAKASGTASPRGAFFDSVADRFTDAVLFLGVAWHLSTTHPGRIALLPMAVMGASIIISYERAKAESLGYDAKGGLMERAERLVALGLGLLFNFLLIPILWVMLALTLLTAGQRFVKVWKQASSEVPVAARRVPVSARARTRAQDRRVARSTTRQVRRRSQLRPPR
ncbi:CDP-alcohol phosphatidyltransferase family protein [Aquihabitans sp. G128]|uniref:CDP-alcohol phosphatidyltransferase family protein n=1 Tax=Aquihabitans sp. G128 TaxID=2849779 RepID=UPI001C2284A5|nr:CDP-alcohol phosphatidyltransferase family protein [Aquihabitans sp. G128]QXC61823.1 CDP-alcohol phosphatidyltransferase family protein [Aquihabitans sp. G128]